MDKKIKEMQIEIVSNFDKLIPTPYTKAWFFYERVPKSMAFCWYCYIDKATNKVIPSDSLTKRKDITVKNDDEFNRIERRVFRGVYDLQKSYEEYKGKRWCVAIIELNEDGNFHISFEYEEHEYALPVWKDDWCREHLGEVPVVTVDMLRE